jgi:hypothetical protein
VQHGNHIIIFIPSAHDQNSPSWRPPAF